MAFLLNNCFIDKTAYIYLDLEQVLMRRLSKCLEKSSRICFNLWTLKKIGLDPYPILLCQPNRRPTRFTEGFNLVCYSLTWCWLSLLFWLFHKTEIINPLSLPQKNEKYDNMLTLAGALVPFFYINAHPCEYSVMAVSAMYNLLLFGFWSSLILGLGQFAIGEAPFSPCLFFLSYNFVSNINSCVPF